MDYEHHPARVTEVTFHSWSEINEQPKPEILLDTVRIPVAIISLADQHDRRQKLSERGIPTGWINNYWPGTDLRQASDEDLAIKLGRDGYAFDPRWPSSVIGCALSHGQVAEWLVREGYPLMLVLEDDAVPASLDFLQSLRDLADSLLPAALAGDSFICHLGARPEQMRVTYTRSVKTKTEFKGPCSLRLNVDPRPTLWRAHAYLISLNAAKNSARRHLQLLTVADDWCARAEKGFFKKLYVVTPAVFLQDEVATSTLDHSFDEITHSHGGSHGIFKRIHFSIRFRVRLASAKMWSRKAVSL